MTRLLTAVFLFASFNAVADDLRTFSNGQVINADDFNHNFQKLEQDIADIPAGPQGLVGNNGAVGPAGPAGAQGPAGADGVAAGLNCSTDQIIKWNGSAWVCSYRYWGELYTGNWDQNGYFANGLPGGNTFLDPPTVSSLLQSKTRQVATWHDSGNEVGEDYTCGRRGNGVIEAYCEFRLAGVGQHIGCTVTVTENSGSVASSCSDSYCYVNGTQLVVGEPARITVVCPD